MSEQASERPIIFVAHSLDAIVVKNVSEISKDILIRSTDGHRRSSTQTLHGAGPSKDTGQSSCRCMASYSWAYPTRTATPF
jgi:hypothetical protein